MYCTSPTISRLFTSIALVFSLLAAVTQGQSITIGSFDELPEESYFATNPGATVNVIEGALINPGTELDSFDFQGATVNLLDGGLGWFTLVSFLDDVNVKVPSGGTIFDRQVFRGESGSTLVTLSGGTIDGNIQMQGNSVLSIESGSVKKRTSGSIVAEDQAHVSIAGGNVTGSTTLLDSARLTVDGGTMSDVQANHSATVEINQGAVGRNSSLNDSAVAQIHGGIVDRDFVAYDESRLLMTGGGLGNNSGVFDDAVVSIVGGSLGDGFRAYGGKLNIYGGTIGILRVGAPADHGAGSVQIFAKQAWIDGVSLPLSKTPQVITQRGGGFLSVELSHGGSAGIHLNATPVVGEDEVYAEALLTISLGSMTDMNDDGAVDAADAGILFSNWGGAGWGDLNGDMVIDAGDAGILFEDWSGDGLMWRTHQGVALPEPASGVGVLCFVTLAVGSRVCRS